MMIAIFCVFDPFVGVVVEESFTDEMLLNEA